MSAAPPPAAVVLTGDELVQGRVHDTNGPFLAATLAQAGYSVRRLLMVADCRAEIAAALRWVLGTGARLVVCSGGLGTTHDDVTMAAVADALGRRLVRHEPAWQHVQDRVTEIAAARGADAAQLLTQAERQAFLPQGARWVPPAGVAPGAVVSVGEASVVVLPGVPRELQAMWPPVLEELSRGLRPPAVRTLRLYGVAEMQVSPVLEETGLPQRDLDVGITATDGEVLVSIAAHSEAAQARADDLVERMTRLLPVYSRDGRTVDVLVAEMLRDRGLRVAVAESCTGGMVGARLTELPGSSDYFVGGVLSYSDDLKRRLLGVPAEMLRLHGAVSAPVAEAMAVGCRDATSADYALAVTGIAGPAGGSAEKPVGTVFTACAGPGDCVVAQHRFFGSRAEIRSRSVTAALHLLRVTLAAAPRGSA